MSEPVLQILNASAGSGKTYNLVKEYIKLLIHQDHASQNFSGLIAMTFTNKASLEMKERIIRALDEVSSPDTFENKAKELTNSLKDELGISADEVISRCAEVLKAILHQYEDFHVMTIDKFNLRLIKSFSRDLDLPSEFEVVLNGDELIEQIVDEMLNKIGEEGNSELSKIMFSYSKANLDEGLTWNFRHNLIKFGKVLNSERNKDVIEHLSEMDMSTERYRLSLNDRNTLDRGHLKLAEELRKCIAEVNLDPDSLPGKSTMMNAINKLWDTDRFLLSEKNIGATLIKNLDLDLKKGQHFPESVKKGIRDIIDYRAEYLQKYAALDLFLKNFFNLALLQFMARQLLAKRKDDQIIRIAEFNSLISNLIQEENAPFIYERLGTRFKHFLLDEFQDTSHLQWINLVPLLHESISQGQKNLIVGDPKQSIYRFRNGVAEQFVALPKIYNPTNNQSIARKSAYFEKMGRVDALMENWRSSPTIVNFNNAFFEQFKSHIPSFSQGFYSSVTQNAKRELPGKVKIRSQETIVDQDEQLALIQQWIEECLNDGFKASDICILGATSKECNRWAIGLDKAGYRVVSADSLLIDVNIKVQLTISYLKWRLHPSGESEKKQFAEAFFRVNKSDYSEYKKYILEIENEKGKVYRKFDERAFINDHFESFNNFFFKYENLYELIQGFYRRIGFKELQDPYLHHLADIVYEFSMKRGPDLKLFLEEYQRTKNDIAVEVPDADDALQIMTMHKSKGLEFPIVMLPSMNFDLSVKSDFLIEVDDYVIKKSPSKEEVLDPLKELYQQEKDQVLTDKINLCYVAMTRPVERLYIENNYKRAGFGKIFHQVLEASNLGVDKEGALEIEIIEGVHKQKDIKAVDEQIFKPTEISDYLWFPDIAFQDNEDLNTKEFLSPEMQFGLQYHLLISRLESADEIENQIQHGIQTGEVSIENKDKLSGELHKLFALPGYRELFVGHTDILSEQDILIDENTIGRPDKIVIKEKETIVIDYKTGIPNSKDQKQVKQYAQILEQMGYPKVSSYLFYSAISELKQIH